MKLNRKWLNEEFVDLSQVSDKEFVEKTKELLAKLKESGVELIREHDLHGVPRDIGKDEVYERYKERAEHIYPEQLFMPRDV